MRAGHLRYAMTQRHKPSCAAYVSHGNDKPVRFHRRLPQIAVYLWEILNGGIRKVKRHVIEKQGCVVVRIFGSVSGRDPPLTSSVLHYKEGLEFRHQ
jgi:hypothetical protein